MKKLVICVAILAMVWTSSAMAVPVAVENAGFELPDYYRKINGFDGEVEDPQIPGTNMPDVPGWDDDCTRDWPRSGVNGAVSGHYTRTGDWKAFLYHGNGEGLLDDIVYQMTNQTIGEDDNEVYTLSAWCLPAGPDTFVTLELSFFYVDGAGAHIELAANQTDAYWDSVNPGDCWHECTAEFTVADVPGSVGEKLGIKFRNVDIGNSHGWLGIDDVELDVIPEPATMILLGLGGLLSLRRRRA